MNISLGYHTPARCADVPWESAPRSACFTIDRAFAEEILRLAEIVLSNRLNSVVRIDNRVRWLSNDPNSVEQIPSQAILEHNWIVIYDDRFLFRSEDVTGLQVETLACYIDSLARFFEIKRYIPRGGWNPPRRFLDLSTAHLHPATRSLLSDPRQRRILAYPHPDGCGWFVYVRSDYAPDESELPKDICDCIREAVKWDCDYILFDCDGLEYSNLPIYED